ncbi:MAG: HNH endonuclease [bacterium]|nr:HNH endonuclease [bacterium]
MSSIFRSPSTTRIGGSFSEQTKVRVWNAMNGASYQPLKDWRYDVCGRLVRWQDYGKTTQYGWEIDHINPVARGGSDDITNLQGLHWSSNRSKSNTVGVNYCTLG